MAQDSENAHNGAQDVTIDETWKRIGITQFDPLIHIPVQPILSKPERRVTWSKQPLQGPASLFPWPY